MKKILVTAYAVNPYKGSEDGTGWNMICQIARYQKVVAITRENNEEDIKKYCEENDFAGKENLQFLYFDWPWYLRFWKRKNKGALLYFYLWQMTIVRFIKKQKIDYDIVHNLNFHSDWTPTFLWRLKKPLVWGPVGHHHQYPATYIRTFYGIKALLLDRIKWITKLFFWKIDPFLYLAKNKATYIIGINSSVKKMLRIPAEKMILLPAVGAHLPTAPAIPKKEKFEILSVGRFVPLKGFDLTIKAFSKFYHQLPEGQQEKVQLTLVGKGPFAGALKALIKKEELEEGVQVIDWIAQKELMEIYKRASVFCFPSHEGAGMVVPEALAFGLPVICIDNYGPGEFIDKTCGRKVFYGKYKETVRDLAFQLQQLFVDSALLQELSKGAVQHYQQYFTWEKKGECFHQLYQSIGSSKEKEENEKDILCSPV